MFRSVWFVSSLDMRRSSPWPKREYDIRLSLSRRGIANEGDPWCVTCGSYNFLAGYLC